eukprot:TRINITY_DN319_c0_g3_i1.p1 TRINITY_DN319_c0_g3~~TRINITY_DN319_c0_g3_i1.p1  ORF type:complete len:261 (+),score=37.09 TRINITY_DN319_c0_g3_i1:186-968(+)
MDIKFDKMVSEIASDDLTIATNACGILCTLTIASQRARSAVSSSPSIVANIEKALAATHDLPHNTSLLVSQLATVASFRLRFVKSTGLTLLVDLLNKSEDGGEQCNVLHALVSLAGAGRDCHSELYDSLVKSGVTWKARQLMCSPHPNAQINAQALAQIVRSMPQALELEQMGSSDAVHVLALLSCDNRAGGDNRVTPKRTTKPMNQFSPNASKKRTRETPEREALGQDVPCKRALQPTSSAAEAGDGLEALFSVIGEAR